MLHTVASAPFCSKRQTALSIPRCAARCKGVLPSASCALMLGAVFEQAFNSANVSAVATWTVAVMLAVARDMVCQTLV